MTTGSRGNSLRRIASRRSLEYFIGTSSLPPLWLRILNTDQVGESATGTAPMAARRTRREPLDSPGSHCSDHERPAPAPMRKQRGESALDARKPGKRPVLMPAQAFVFPHGPTNNHPVDMSRDRLKFGSTKPTVVRHPATNARSQILRERPERQVTSQRKSTPPQRLAHRGHRLATDRGRKPSADLAMTSQDAPGPKRVAQEVELYVVVGSGSPAVLAVHHPGFVRVHLQSDCGQPLLQMRPHLQRFGLRSAVQDAIISVSAKRDIGVEA